MKGEYRVQHDWRIALPGAAAGLVLSLTLLLMGIPSFTASIVGITMSNFIVMQLSTRAWRTRLQRGEFDRVPSRTAARGLVEGGDR
ncbi:MAG TPA: hypothetical protein DEG43_09065 [Acidimicrobiaceae bacterium]|nr:hypothetical protein [Acidimicrobiaceae bacterium]